MNGETKRPRPEDIGYDETINSRAIANTTEEPAVLSGNSTRRKVDTSPKLREPLPSKGEAKKPTERELSAAALGGTIEQFGSATPTFADIEQISQIPPRTETPTLYAVPAITEEQIAAARENVRLAQEMNAAAAIYAKEHPPIAPEDSKPGISQLPTKRPPTENRNKGILEIITGLFKKAS